MGGLSRVKRLLCISEAEVAFPRRGFFLGEANTRERLETICRAFVVGYNAGILHESDEHEDVLSRVPAEDRGFAYEGLAMQLALFDQLIPGRRRWWRARAGIGGAHPYMFSIAFGMARARMRKRLEFPVNGLDPMSSGLVAEGYGFHHGFFTSPDSAEHRAIPNRVDENARECFDLGYGRSLWFACCGSPDQIANHIDSLGAERHESVWSGVGLAAAYAGGVEDGFLEDLQRRSGRHSASLAQGAAFAAECRTRTDNPAGHTNRACRVFCELDAVDSAELAHLASAGLDFSQRDAYRDWRARLRERFEQHELVL